MEKHKGRKGENNRKGQATAPHQAHRRLQNQMEIIRDLTGGKKRAGMSTACAEICEYMGKSSKEAKPSRYAPPFTGISFKNGTVGNITGIDAPDKGQFYKGSFLLEVETDGSGNARLLWDPRQLARAGVAGPTGLTECIPQGGSYGPGSLTHHPLNNIPDNWTHGFCAKAQVSVVLSEAAVNSRKGSISTIVGNVLPNGGINVAPGAFIQRQKAQTYSTSLFEKDDEVVCTLPTDIWIEPSVNNHNPGAVQSCIAVEFYESPPNSTYIVRIDYCYFLADWESIPHSLRVEPTDQWSKAVACFRAQALAKSSSADERGGAVSAFHHEMKKEQARGTVVDHLWSAVSNTAEKWAPEALKLLSEAFL